MGGTSGVHGFSPSAAVSNPQYWVMDDVALTPEEYHDLFGDQHATKRRPRSRRIITIAAFIVAGMLASVGAWAALNIIRNSGKTNDLDQLRDWAAEEVDTSRHSELVAEVRFESILDSRTGGYVLIPPDGIVHLDHRSWSQADLADTVHHEIGHLLDHATRELLPLPRGGLESEVWAECSSVAAGARGLDGESETDEYRCTPAEFATYTEAVRGLP